MPIETKPGVRPKRQHDKGVCVGFGLAIAEINRLHDQPTICADAWRSSGYTYEDFVRVGLDEYDLEELRTIQEWGATMTDDPKHGFTAGEL